MFLFHEVVILLDIYPLPLLLLISVFEIRMQLQIAAPAKLFLQTICDFVVW
jgi:hypothetical protein